MGIRAGDGVFTARHAPAVVDSSRRAAPMLRIGMPAWGAVVCAVAVGASTLATDAGTHHRPAVVAARASGLESLPATERDPISGALGRAEPAFAVSGLRASNPTQRLSASWSRSGVWISSGATRFRISLDAVGRPSSMRRLAPVAPTERANRVTYSRGSLLEWYANGPLGIEQGFTLPRAPSGAGTQLTLALAITGRVHVARSGGGILLRGAGRSVRYGGLLAADARGRRLPSSLSLARGRILIRVDVRGARFPVQIDPLIQQDAELTASDGAADNMFGNAVAVSGNAVFVGAQAAGAAYVFVEPASGWSGVLQQTATLAEAAPQPNDAFGFSIAASGNTVVVGADGHGNQFQGAAFVFVEPANGWTGTVTSAATLAANDAKPFDSLGYSVAISGSTVAAGVRQRQVGGNAKQGAVDVFVEPPAGWSGTVSQAAELTAPDGNAGDELGSSVAVTGPTVLAGAPDHQVGNNMMQGAAYVFEEPAAGWSGSVTAAAELTASNGATGDELGLAAALSGDTAFAGGFAGAYAFVEPGSGWSGQLTQSATLTAGGVPANGAVGTALSADGNIVIAGAPMQQVGSGNAEPGAAFVFVDPRGGWSGDVNQTTELTGSDAVNGDTLGDAVGIAGDLVVAGAMGHKVDNNSMQGSAYVFTVGAPSITISTPAAGTPVFTLGQTVDASYSCAAPAAGVTVARCSGPVANGTPIDTATTGPHTFTVTATGTDGFTTTQSVDYMVLARLRVAVATARARVRHGVTKVALVCTGGTAGGMCRGRLSLAVLMRRRAHSGHRGPVTIAVVVAGAAYTVPSGHRRVVRLRLDHTALALLASARGHRVRMRATASIAGGATTHRSISIRGHTSARRIGIREPLARAPGAAFVVRAS